MLLNSFSITIGKGEKSSTSENWKGREQFDHDLFNEGKGKAFSSHFVSVEGSQILSENKIRFDWEPAASVARVKQLSLQKWNLNDIFKQIRNRWAGLFKKKRH